MLRHYDKSVTLPLFILFVTLQGNSKTKGVRDDSTNKFFRVEEKGRSSYNSILQRYILIYSSLLFPKSTGSVVNYIDHSGNRTPRIPTPLLCVGYQSGRPMRSKGYRMFTVSGTLALWIPTT